MHSQYQASRSWSWDISFCNLAMSLTIAVACVDSHNMQFCSLHPYVVSILTVHFAWFLIHPTPECESSLFQRIGKICEISRRQDPLRWSYIIVFATGLQSLRTSLHFFEKTEKQTFCSRLPRAESGWIWWGRASDWLWFNARCLLFSFTNIHKGNFPDLSACFSWNWKELDSSIALLKSEV